MNIEQITLLLLLLTSSTLYATRWLPFEATSVLTIAALALTGLLSPHDALSGLSSTATVTVAAMFVLSAGLMRTGALEAVTISLARYSKGSPRRLLVLLAITVPIASAFVNNTPVVIMMVPVILSLSQQFNVRPSKLLIPVSYLSILGGTLTLLGTSTNILIDDLYRTAGGPGFGIFDFSILGLIYTIVGGGFVIFASQRLLPDRAPLTDLVSMEQSKIYISEIVVGANSSLIGESVEVAFARIATAERRPPHMALQSTHRRIGRLPQAATRANTRARATEDGLELLELFRAEAIFRAEETRNLILQADDRLLVAGTPSKLTHFLKSTQSAVAAVLEDGQEKSPPDDVAQKVVEAVVLPDSSLIDRYSTELELHRRHDVSILGIQHRGRRVRLGAGHRRLESGDVLLLQGLPGQLQAASETAQLLLVEGVDRLIVRSTKNRLALVIMLAVIGLAAFSPIRIVVLALAGAGLMVVTNCLRVDEAVRALESGTLLLLVAAIPLGLALESTGLAQQVVALLVEWLGNANPLLFLSIFYLLTNLLAQFISAKAVAVLFTPIALTLATSLGVNPEPLLMVIAFGCAASFLTPMGHQVNAIVMGPGGYTFTDYVKVGLPMTILLWITGTVCIPLIWPL